MLCSGILISAIQKKLMHSLKPWSHEHSHPKVRGRVKKVKLANAAAEKTTCASTDWSNGR